MPKRCPRCGGSLEGWEAYCPYCGAGLLGVFEKAWRFISRPDEAAEYLLPREGVRSSLKSLLLLSLFPAAGVLLLTLISVMLLAPLASLLRVNLAKLGALFAALGFSVGWAGSITVVAVEAVLVYVILGTLRGVRAPSLGECFAALVYSESPTLLSSLLLAAPFLGGLLVFIVGLYGLRILYKLLRRGFGIGISASLLCVLAVLLLHIGVMWVASVEAPTLSQILALGR